MKFYRCQLIAKIKPNANTNANAYCEHELLMLRPLGKQGSTGSCRDLLEHLWFGRVLDNFIWSFVSVCVSVLVLLVLSALGFGF